MARAVTREQLAARREKDRANRKQEQTRKGRTFGLLNIRRGGNDLGEWVKTTVLTGKPKPPARKKLLSYRERRGKARFERGGISLRQVDWEQMCGSSRDSQALERARKTKRLLLANKRAGGD